MKIIGHDIAIEICGYRLQPHSVPTAHTQLPRTWFMTLAAYESNLHPDWLMRSRDHPSPVKGVVMTCDLLVLGTWHKAQEYMPRTKDAYFLLIHVIQVNVPDDRKVYINSCKAPMRLNSVSPGIKIPNDWDGEYNILHAWAWKIQL